jgi:serine phosphatase RsbU (regulator of sigma subunit)
MPSRPAELAALADLLERSDTLFGARLRPDGTVLSATRPLQRFADSDLVGRPVQELLTAPQRPALTCALEAVGEGWTTLTLGFSDGSPRPAEDRRVFLRRDGDDILLVAEPALGERDRLVEQVLELNEDLISAQRRLSRRQRELERAQAEAATAMERVRRLESIMLAGLASPDLESALESLLRIARDVFRSDRATVLLRTEDGRHLRIAAASGLDEDRVASVRVPLGRGFAGGIAADARARVIDDIDQAEIWSAYLRESGGSVAGVPLVLEGDVIGVLHVSSLDKNRFTAEDLALLERIGERASLTIGHAQLRERERRVADTLQHSLLQEKLPTVSGVRLVARYISRAHGVHVGGDFYDAVVVEGDLLALSIGDVAGKGLDAASMMGRLRNALRAYAVEAKDPADLLRRLDRLVVEEDAMVTAQHFLLDPATGELQHSNAGHPPALRVTAAHEPEWLQGALAPPLGTGWEPRPLVEHVLAPGDRVLLFTDGLVERRDSTLDDGLAVLAEAAVGAPEGELDAWCDHLLGCLSGAAGGFEDDVALLAFELVRD